MPNHIHAILTLNGGYIDDGNLVSVVTKHARRLGYTFEWQRLYYEHLIQNEHSLHQISNYIKNNVKKWDEDRFFGE